MQMIICCYIFFPKDNAHRNLSQTAKLDIFSKMGNWTDQSSWIPEGSIENAEVQHLLTHPKWISQRHLTNFSFHIKLTD